MPSRHFSRLKKSCDDLKFEFLNFSSRIDGSYTKSELKMCRAYIAFAHAEFEHYLEEIAVHALDKGLRNWVSNQRISKSIAALFIYRHSSEIVIPENPNELSIRNQINEITHRVVATQKREIRKNHGIKRNNFGQLFIPLGLDITIVPEPLLIQLDGLGKRRGDLVHTTESLSLARIRDPFSDEASDVNQLLGELQGVDHILSKL
ncbi:HEPN domain-containing protein [Hoeflea sp.]|uniref:HEPN domain-containing protein n=1 Tax=Hoeflea sp. TaxID=1940281 RepID=UPI003BB14E45